MHGLNTEAAIPGGLIGRRVASVTNASRLRPSNKNQLGFQSALVTVIQLTHK
jgi:hypothetical protein